MRAAWDGLHLPGDRWGVTLFREHRGTRCEGGCETERPVSVRFVDSPAAAGAADRERRHRDAAAAATRRGRLARAGRAARAAPCVPGVGEASPRTPCSVILSERHLLQPC